ncbi:hypothetical protein SAMN04487890_11170 [Mucilaginibacter polytrichastri]|nr:hypothetical protein SAMN04487890_11170 [Mucilaginibacter polytrichastri]
MLRKILIFSFRIFARLFFLLSLLFILLVRLSEKGDILDRNSGWIAVAFFIALVFFICTFYIKYPAKYIYRQKTADELRNEIRKSNIDLLRKEI